MTHAERIVIAAASTRPLIWRADEDARFVRLTAHPCPLLDTDGSCSVYAVRPFNCRRFACLRTGDEPWSDALTDLDRDDRRQLVVIQRHAQRWARAHGWTEAMQ